MTEAVDQHARDLAREASNRINGHERECALRWSQSHQAIMSLTENVSANGREIRAFRGLLFKFGIATICLLGGTVVALLVYIYEKQLNIPWAGG